MEIKNSKQSMETIRKILLNMPEAKDRIMTVPDIFNRGHNENFLSDYLAYILNPSINGAGLQPLIKLIEKHSAIGVNILENLTRVETLGISVAREHTFEDGRRIDILINCNDKLIIGIENKIFAGEQHKQTVDYAKSIEEEFPDSERVLFYLTHKDQEPESTDFIMLRYKDLVNRLKKVNFNYQDDIRRKVIFDEFILHVEEHMMDKKESTISEQTKLYLEYRNEIEKLEAHYLKDSAMVHKEFEGMTRSCFEEDEIWEFDFKDSITYNQVYKKQWLNREKEIFIHYEFWLTNYDKFLNILKSDKLILGIEIEMANRSLFFDLFDEEYERIKDFYIENKMEYRPRKRRHAIAYYTVDNYFQVGYKKENRLREDIMLLRQLEESIEKVYLEFSKKLG